MSFSKCWLHVTFTEEQALLTNSFPLQMRPDASVHVQSTDGSLLKVSSRRVILYQNAITIKSLGPSLQLLSYKEGWQRFIITLMNLLYHSLPSKVGRVWNVRTTISDYVIGFKLKVPTFSHLNFILFVQNVEFSSSAIRSALFEFLPCLDAKNHSFFTS